MLKVWMSLMPKPPLSLGKQTVFQDIQAILLLSILALGRKQKERKCLIKEWEKAKKIPNQRVGESKKKEKRERKFPIKDRKKT